MSILTTVTGEPTSCSRNPHDEYGCIPSPSAQARLNVAELEEALLEPRPIPRPRFEPDPEVEARLRAIAELYIFGDEIAALQAVARHIVG